MTALPLACPEGRLHTAEMKWRDDEQPCLHDDEEGRGETGEKNKKEGGVKRQRAEGN